MAIQQMEVAARKSLDEVIEQLLEETGAEVHKLKETYPKDKRVFGMSIISKKQVYLYLPTIKKGATATKVPYALAVKMILLHELVHVKKKIKSNQTPFDEAVVDQICKKLYPDYKMLQLPLFMDKEDRLKWRASLRKGR